MAKTGLFIALPSSATVDAVRAAPARTFLARMHTAGVAVVAVITDASVAIAALTALQESGCDTAIPMPTWNALGFLRTGKTLGLDLAGSWLVTGDAAGIAVAATAGLHGVVLIGIDPPVEDTGLVINRAEDLGDVPRVLIPRGGGCWH
jgi:hypothetical protein